MLSRLDLIESAANNATNIVSKLLATKNFNQRAQDISEMGSMLDKISNLGTSFYDPQYISLEINCNDECYIRCHESEFLSAIINLIKNAAQALDESTGKIIVSCRAPKDSERKHHMAPKGEFCVLTVIDNGPGVPENLQERLFEPFFTTKHQGQGTGLGLWCLYELIASMGGSSITPTQNQATLCLHYLYLLCHAPKSSRQIILNTPMQMFPCRTSPCY